MGTRCGRVVHETMTEYNFLYYHTFLALLFKMLTQGGENNNFIFYIIIIIKILFVFSHVELLVRSLSHSW